MLLAEGGIPCRKKAPPTSSVASVGNSDVSSPYSDSESEAEDEDGDTGPMDPPVHVFFDIKSMLVSERHVPNLLVAEREHNPNPHVFCSTENGPSCIDQFFDWLKGQIINTTSRIIALAHNFEGYDGIVYTYHGWCQQIHQLHNGGNILQLDLGKIRFIDSMSFFQMPLSAYPKGYFPHKSNRPENQAYVGPLPLMNDYFTQSMSVKGREDFETWYAERLRDHPEFDWQHELKLYGKSDVALRKAGCLQFKEDFESKTGSTPSTTRPSLRPAIAT